MEIEVTSPEPQVAELVAIKLKSQAEALKVKAEISAGRMKDIQVIHQLPDYSNVNGIYTK